MRASTRCVQMGGRTARILLQVASPLNVRADAGTAMTSGITNLWMRQCIKATMLCGDCISKHADAVAVAVAVAVRRPVTSDPGRGKANRGPRAWDRVHALRNTPCTLALAILRRN